MNKKVTDVITNLLKVITSKASAQN